MSDVIIARSIGVNIPDCWDRVETIKKDYDCGLGSIEVYAVYMGAPGYNQEDISRLALELKGPMNDSTNPLYVGVHLAHRRHGFYLLDGWNEHNKKCIDTAVETASEMGAKHLTVHVVGIYEGQKIKRALVERTLGYLSEAVRRLGCTAVFENMYTDFDDDRTPLYCTVEGMPDIIKKRIRDDPNFSTCFDETHLAFHIHSDLGMGKTDAMSFRNEYKKRFRQFLKQEPIVIHISSFDLRYKRDAYGNFSSWNRKQLEAAVLYIKYISSYEGPVPIVLEVEYKKWNKKGDEQNLKMATRVVGEFDGDILTAAKARKRIQALFSQE